MRCRRGTGLLGSAIPGRQVVAASNRPSAVSFSWASAIDDVLTGASEMDSRGPLSKLNAHRGTTPVNARSKAADPTDAGDPDALPRTGCVDLLRPGWAGK